MAVSLKKPSKVDLTKPDLSRNLPECTPVHLIDEEETIKHLPTQVDNEVQIRFHHSDEEDRKIWDLCDEFLRCNQIKRIIGIVALVVLVLAVLSVVIAFVVNADVFKEAFSSFSDEVVAPLFEYFDGNPLFVLIVSILAIVPLVSVVRHISHINRF